MWLLKKRNSRQSSDRSNRSRNSNDSGSNRGRSTPTPIITRNLKRDIPQSYFDDAESNSFTSKTNSNSQLSSLQNEARGFGGMNSRSSFYKSDSGRSMSRQGGGSMTRDLPRRHISDAAIEREISAAARRLGESIQRVVLDAKLGKQAKRRGSVGTGQGPSDKWRTTLLQILGGSDSEQEKLNNMDDGNSDGSPQRLAPVKRTDVDILLKNSHCDKFILRCMENELPPNLIHCMRLLRVLELKNSSAEADVKVSKNGEQSKTSVKSRGIAKAKPVSIHATQKVKRLLCLLCGDPSVGEQLRPHLFGLLALSGARYPTNAIHVAEAASSVIVAFSKECLSTSLVWFLHERNMIVHMTDDVKELCGMSSTASTTANSTSCLYGKDAESHGLWLFALTAIVSMVKESCYFNCVELLRDFEHAGGYHVLRYAMAHSGQANLKKLLHLAATLCYCKIDTSDDTIGDTSFGTVGDGYSDDDGEHLDNEENLASNLSAFEVIEDLMERSVPLLSSYGDVDDDSSNMVIETRDDMRALAKFSVEHSLQRIKEDDNVDEDEMDSSMYGSEIIVCVMQIYSDHPSNFTVIEGTFDVLTKFLLAFPTFDGTEVKTAILSTLEYACTGLPEADCWKPLTVASETFFSLCKSILRLSLDIDHAHENKESIEAICSDSVLLGASLEKLLQVDESSMGQIMIDAGIMGEVLHEVMSLLMMVPTRSHDQSKQMHLESINDVYCAICRIIELIINNTVGVSRVSSPRLDSPNRNVFDPFTPEKNRSVELDAFLTFGMTELGLRACNAAVLVFETKMRFAESEALMDDTGCAVRILNKIVDSFSSALERNQISNCSKQLHAGRAILEMLKRVLRDMESAQDTFRVKGGFEILLRVLFCLEGSGSEVFALDGDVMATKSGDTILALVKSVYGVFDAATKVTFAASSLASSRAVDLLSEEPNGISKNREYISTNGFYESLVKALRGVGLFKTPTYATAIMNLSLGLLHPSLSITMEENEIAEDPVTNVATVDSLRNPDAAKLVLGLAISLPKDLQFRNISEFALNVLIQLCSPDNAGTTLEQIAHCGLCRTLISDDGFSFIFDDLEHPLHSRFVALLRRVASFKMTYMDSVALLRFIAHPLLTTSHGQSKERSELRLPIINSSVEGRKSFRVKLATDLERNINLRLKTLSVIAKRGDRVARCYLGGADLNNIHLSKNIRSDSGLDERLYSMAEDGQIKFIEIDKLQARTKRPASSDGPNPVGANLWSPAYTTGFSYSLWMRLPVSEDIVTGNVCVFDISSNMDGSSDKKCPSGRQQFISIWYDLLSQCFNVIFTGSTQPICFPVSPLSPGVWHHILLTYQPPKRSVLSRKAVIGLCVDGRPLEVDIKIDAVALPPSSIMYVGVPNPLLAFNEIIKGTLPIWEVGSMLLLSRILGPRDAVSIFSAGPDFHGQFWGDRPQRLSLSATATSLFSMLAGNCEKGGLARGLKKRSIPEIEAACHVMRDKVNSNGRGSDSVMLSSVGLFCNLSPEFIICAFHPASSTSIMREDSVAADKGHFSRRLVNVAEIHSTNDLVSSDAVAYGKGSVICPVSFGDNVQWLGGPNVLLPILNAAKASTSISLTLRVLRECVRQHIPNLEMLHGGGGYRMLALLLTQKNVMDSAIFEHCFAFAVHGFEPATANEREVDDECKTRGAKYSWTSSDNWALVDLDALKYLLKNHQVWNLSSSGPDLSLRIMCLLNGLVSTSSKHCSFNARRLHLLGMVKWTIHLMVEISELYTYGSLGADITKDVGSKHKAANETLHVVLSAYRSGWLTQTLSISSVSVGGDPGVPVLLECKTFLRRVLAHMLTPDDLGDIAGALIYTLEKDKRHEDVAGQLGYENTVMSNGEEDEELSMGSVTRIYLLRLLEELVVDGVNEISAASENIPVKSDNTQPNIQDLPAREVTGKNAQLFLSAFADVLTPVWFACILEDCRDESSASAAFRLLIIMLQNSPSFARAFEENDGFAPFVLSIPKYSTSASITLAMLSQLLHAPLLHLPCFGTLDPEQLCAIFDTESDDEGLILQENNKGGIETNIAPNGGIFSLLAECLGRNIQLEAMDSKLGFKARKTNEAILVLLTHRHTFSSAFQNFCRTPEFLEPMAQTLCLVHNDRVLTKSITNLSGSNVQSGGESTVFYDWPNEKDGVLSRSESNDSSICRERRGHLTSMDVNADFDSPTRRFVGDTEGGGGGLGLVRLLRHTINHAVYSGPKAVELIAAVFRSFSIYANSDDVEAFHMILIEQCHLIVQDALQRGELIAIANCIGISSVLLDRLLMGFFTSQPILEAFDTILATLKAVSDPDSYASRTLMKEDTDNVIRLNAAHCARLTCLVALQRSKPAGPWDLGDEILQLKIIAGINSNLHQLLFASSNSNVHTKRKNPNQGMPLPGSRLYNFWQSASLKRCEASADSCKFPDISEIDEPDRAFIVALMSELHSLLNGKNQSLREETAYLIKTAVKHRSGIMSDLFVKDLPTKQGVKKHVDLLNGEGFGNFLQYNVDQETSDESIEQIRLQSFFGWIEANRENVDDIFEDIGREALQYFPTIFSIKVPSPEDAIDREQKEMFSKIPFKEQSDKTMMLRQKRNMLSRTSNDRTDISQAVWKRQGLDDLSSGAMMWKSLLRQLKGSRSVWEGGSRPVQQTVFSKEELMTNASFPEGDDSYSPQPAKSKNENGCLVRWKLDMTEGYERQRRKLLPNYEFYALYNVEESFDRSVKDNDYRKSNLESSRTDVSFGNDQIPNTAGLSLDPDSMVATADLLKKMQLGTTQMNDAIEDIEDEGDADGDEDVTEDIVTEFGQSKDDELRQSQSVDIDDSRNGNLDRKENNENESVPNADELSDDSGEFSDEDDEFSQHQHHYDLITGLLQTGDIPEKSHNVQRCTGLEVCKALLIRCRDAIYIIDGFEQSDEDGLKGNINRVERAKSTFQVNIRPKNFHEQETTTDQKLDLDKDDAEKKKVQVKTNSSDNSRYQHRCKRLSYEELYAVYRRRYQLQQIALEFYDSHSNGTFIAFSSNQEREDILNILLHSSLPNSIFNSGPGTSPNYDKFMKSQRSKITSQWVRGKMTNFDFLMHLNSFAGRSYNDLTQYPVFPWVIADYESEEIDLNNPNVYRDLSKPMGNLGLARAEQFKERYEALENNFSRGDEPPAFHYGTHYSCAAYVLNYLLRLEPFSRLALSLQGGKFDLADRLFHNIGASWKSASRDNLQDVRELIPEFFYLPEFLENSNSFDFGVKQDGILVHNVTLPPWAKGDPRRFIRINRQALESDHVSRNLHKWIDLVFGYKQRGPKAIEALNTFVHVTYEGTVDIDAIEDPVQRDSIIAQIQNFGQTPSRLERKPFPARNVIRPTKSVDFNSLPLLEPLTPPFCVVGWPHTVHMRVAMDDTCKVGMMGQNDCSVGDMCVSKGQLIGVGKTCALISSVKKYYRFGGSNNGISVHVAIPSARNWEVNRVLTIHDDMHRAPITAIKPSRDGQWLVTGCMDSTVRVWKYESNHMRLQSTLCGHDGGKITCIDISTTFGTIVTGASDGTVLMWDLRTLSFLRELDHDPRTNKRAMPKAVISISLNDKTGDVLILVDSKVTIFDINGNLVAKMKNPYEAFSEKNRPSCAISTDCPEWMENGVVAVTGHKDGTVKMWGVNRDKEELWMQHEIQPKVHECEITCLKIEGKRQDTLLCGDTGGKMSLCKTVQLESLDQKDLKLILGEC